MLAGRNGRTFIASRKNHNKARFKKPVSRMMIQTGKILGVEQPHGYGKKNNFAHR